MNIHLEKNGATTGPHSKEEVMAMLAAGTLDGSEMAWTEGLTGWKPLSEILGSLPPAAGNPPPSPASVKSGNPYAAPATNAAPPVIRAGAGGPTGIGGWLLFFCLSLTVLSPALALASVVGTMNELADVDHAEINRLVWFETIGFAVLVVAGIFAGSRLWGRKPGAVGLVKKFLLVRLVGAVVIEIAVIAMMSGIPEINSTAGTSAALTQIFREAIYFAIWFSYLGKSKRVANTFPETAA